MVASDKTSDIVSFALVLRRWSILGLAPRIESHFLDDGDREPWHRFNANPPVLFT